MLGSFIRIGPYVSRIAFGRFARKTLARAKFMVTISALVFWSRAWVTFRLSRLLSEVQAAKSGMVSTLVGKRKKICRVGFVREKQIKTW